MKDYKYKLSFASKIVPIDSEKGEKIISIASKNDNLIKLLPKEVNLSDNIGFQLFQSEAFLVNKLNRNADGVRTLEGMKLKESAPFGFIDVSHNREKLVGVIANSVYTDIKTGKELSEDIVKDMTEPFAVSITGIIWKAANPDLAYAIANINSKDSELKDKVYCSWECIFNSFAILLIDKDKFNFSEGRLITNEKEVSELSKKLQCYGGTGMTSDGKKVGRIPIEDVDLLGIGLVEDPAGQLDPIVVDNKRDSKASLIEMTEEKLKEIILNTIQEQKNIENSENKISQANISIVNDTSNILSNKMKIEKFEQLTDENIKEVGVAGLKEIFASSTKDLIDSKIKEISVEHTNKLAEKDKAIEAATKATQDLNKSVEEINQKLSKASEDLQKVLNENAQRDQLEAFSARMSTIEDGYDLDEKQKEIVANKVKTLASDDDFNKYLAEIEVLLAAKKKAKFVPFKKGDNKDDDKDADKDKQQAKASIEDKTAIDDALKNGEKDKTIIANTSTVTETIMQRAQKAFGLDGWEVTNKRKDRI